MNALIRNGSAALLATAIIGSAIPAQAQNAYPAKPVRILVGFAAGGATDIAGRLIAQKLTETTGQSFLVENRPGASGLTTTRCPRGVGLTRFELGVGSLERPVVTGLL